MRSAQAHAHAVASGHRRRRLLASLCAVFFSGTCLAQHLAPSADNRPWVAVSNHTLDQLRGGFDVAPGLTVSFGISRAVTVNGQLLTSTSFQLDDMAKLTAAQASLAGKQAGLPPAQVVQNGPGNTLALGAHALPLGIFVQNTLNQQTIHSETVIQATSSGLSMVKSLNLQATLSESINNAIRNR